MKNLLAIILATLMVGCVSPTEPEPDNGFEPYKVGTWWVASPTQAEWEGVKTKIIPTESDADTIILRQRGQRNLELIYAGSTNEGRKFIEFTLSFTDSTITNDHNVDINHVNVRSTKQTESLHFGHYTSFGVNPDRFKGEVGGSYFCGESVPNGLNLFIQLDSEGNPFRNYVVQSDGFVDVLNDEFCTR